MPRRKALVMPYRRSHERLSVNTWATLIINQGLEKKSLLKDLCSRGAGLVSNYPLKLNDKVTIIIKEPFFDSPLSKLARVAWSREIKNNLWGSGLDFGLDNRIELNPT